MGIDNILQIFEADFVQLGKLRSTYNGIMGLSFITKADAMPEFQHNSAKKAPSKKKETHQKNMYLKLNKAKNQEVVDNSAQITNDNAIKFIAIGGEEYTRFLTLLAEKYDLPFVPFLISLQCSIYHGTQLLTSWTQVETKKVLLYHIL